MFFLPYLIQCIPYSIQFNSIQFITHYTFRGKLTFVTRILFNIALNFITPCRAIMLTRTKVIAIGIVSPPCRAKELSITNTNTNTNTIKITIELTLNKVIIFFQQRIQFQFSIALLQ
jgi:hypothetical protein